MADFSNIEKDNLLFLKVLRKEATKEEIEYLDKKYNQFEQKRILEDLVDFSWEQSSTSDSNQSDSNQEVYQKIKTELGEKFLQTRSIRPIFDFYFFSKIAAVFFIFFTVSFFLFKSFSPATEIQNQVVAVRTLSAATNFGEKRIISLPDQTKVYLNFNSEITYPESFSGTERNVTLSGEAYFEVTHNPDQPFVINSGSMQVKVLGTSFNFNSAQQEVALEEGKVEVTSGNHQLILVEGEKAELQNGQLLKSTYDPLEYLAWKDGIIYIENKTVAEIFSVLEKWYGVSVTIPAEIDQNRVFQGNFNNKTLSNILDGLCFSLNCSFEINQKNVILHAKK